MDAGPSAAGTAHISVLDAARQAFAEERRRLAKVGAAAHQLGGPHATAMRVLHHACGLVSVAKPRAVTTCQHRLL